MFLPTTCTHLSCLLRFYENNNEMMHDVLPHFLLSKIMFFGYIQTPLLMQNWKKACLSQYTPIDVIIHVYTLQTWVGPTRTGYQPTRSVEYIDLNHPEN